MNSLNKRLERLEAGKADIVFLWLDCDEDLQAAATALKSDRQLSPSSRIYALSWSRATKEQMEVQNG